MGGPPAPLSPSDPAPGPSALPAAPLAVAPAALARARAVKARHADRLLALPGVTGCDAGLRRRAGRLRPEACLRVYVAAKRPRAELGPGEALPVELDGVPVDVLQRTLEPLAGAGPPAPPPPSPPPLRSTAGHDVAAARAIADRHRAALLAHPDVVGLDVGLRERGGRLAAPRELCLRLHVARKVRDPDRRLPTEVEGLPVDVLVRPPPRPAADFTRYRPLIGGSCLGADDLRAAGTGRSAVGTLGCLAVRRADGALAAITNEHVTSLAADGVVYQWTEAPPIGTVTAAVVDARLDAGLVTLSSGPVAAQILEIGAVRGVGAAALGSAVRKRGATTGLTYGVVDGVDVTQEVIRGDGSRATMTGQFWVRPDPAVDPAADFAAGGDSGAVVVDAANLVVGLLHHAGSGGTGGAMGLCSPMDEVCNGLGADVLVAAEAAPGPPPVWTYPPPSESDPAPAPYSPGAWTQTPTGGAGGAAVTSPGAPPSSQYPGAESDTGATTVLDTRKTVWGGTSIGPCGAAADGTRIAGTLGCLMVDRVTGKHLALSNYHVLAGAATPWAENHAVYPALPDGGRCGPGGDELGPVLRALGQGTLDAAVAEIDTAVWRPDCRIQGLGVPRGAGDPVLGSVVRKAGKTTGLTSAVVDGVDVTVVVGGLLLGYVYHGYWSATDDSGLGFRVVGPGDSGSAVVDVAGQVVGLVAASEADGRAMVGPRMTHVQDGLACDVCTASPPLVESGTAGKYWEDAGAGAGGPGGSSTAASGESASWADAPPTSGVGEVAPGFGRGAFWLDSGDSRHALVWPRVERTTGSVTQVPGYTEAELPYAPADLGGGVAEVPVAVNHPPGYATQAYRCAGGAYVTLGGVNVEDPPGYMTMENEVDDAGRALSVALPFSQMPDLRAFRAAWGEEALFEAALTLDGGDTCLWRGSCLTRSKYVRASSWTPYRQDLVELWVLADGAVEVRQAGGAVVASRVDARACRSAAGAVPFARWFRLRMTLVLDRATSPDPDGVPDATGWGAVGVFVDSVRVLGGAAAEWALNPYPGVPEGANQIEQGLCFSGCDFGSVDGGGVTMRDLTLALSSADRANLLAHGFFPAVPGSFAITCYAADTDVSGALTDPAGHSPGFGGRQRAKPMDGDLTDGGKATAEGSILIDVQGVVASSDDHFRFADYQATGCAWVIDPALFAAYGWNQAEVDVGTVWYAQVETKNGYRNELRNPLSYPEAFMLKEFASHRSDGVPFVQERRTQKTPGVLFSVARFRGQPGLEGRILARQSTTGGGRLTIGTDATWMLSFPASTSEWAGAELHLYHTPLRVGVPAPPEPPLGPLTGYPYLRITCVDSFGHYRTGDVGGSTTAFSPGAGAAGADVPCYGSTAYEGYGGRSDKWPTALGTYAVERPGRWGAADGCVRLQGAASCLMRNLPDCDDTGFYEGQMGFSYKVDAPATWPSGVQYVRVLTLCNLFDYTEWPPQVQLVLELDREGYLHANRPSAAFAGCPGALGLRSDLPIAAPERWHSLELRTCLDAFDPLRPTRSRQGYLTLVVDGVVVGHWEDVATVLDPRDTLHAPAARRRFEGFDLLKLGGDPEFPSDPQTTVNHWFDDYYTGDIRRSEAPTGDLGREVEFFNTLQILPLLPVAAPVDGSGYPLVGAGTPQGAVQDPLPDDEATYLLGAPGTQAQVWEPPLGFRYPHVYDPETDGLTADRPRFIGYQAFAKLRAADDAPLSGSAPFQTIFVGLPLPAKWWLGPAATGTAGAVHAEGLYGFVGWLDWATGAVHRFYTVMHSQFDDWLPALWNPAVGQDDQYGLSAHDFNRMLVGLRQSLASPGVRVTQFGVEVFGSLPRNRQRAQVIRTRGEA